MWKYVAYPGDAGRGRQASEKIISRPWRCEFIILADPDPHKVPLKAIVGGPTGWINGYYAG